MANKIGPEKPTYESLGVSAAKDDVHNALALIDPGLFPGAFCKAVPDVFDGSDQHCVVLHADGAGTKAALAYIEYRRTGRADVFEGIAIDSAVMNLDDLLCVGATGPFVLSNTIGRNAKLVGGDAIAAIIRGYARFAEAMSPFGVEILPCGGETADVGDLVRTIVVDSSMAARLLRRDFINCRHVKAGHVIVGLASFGQATYERSYNSGIGANGFTAIRHEVLASSYKTSSPETFAPDIDAFVYRGTYQLDDPLPGTTIRLADALLAPTRTYAPIVRVVLSRFRPHISAMFHNTGGGQTKCLRFGAGVRYEKDNLFDLPPIFRFLRDEIGMPTREMVRVFNLGHRFEIVCDPSVANEIIDVAAQFNVEGRIVGRVTAQDRGPILVIEVDGETVEFASADGDKASR